jgi:hypothetical protein
LESAKTVPRILVSRRKRQSPRGDSQNTTRAATRRCSRAPDGRFLREFVETGYYFVHAVKCGTKAKFPGFGRSALPRDRRSIGEPLVRACASAHLGAELKRLSASVHWANSPTVRSAPFSPISIPKRGRPRDAGSIYHWMGSVCLSSTRPFRLRARCSGGSYGASRIATSNSSYRRARLSTHCSRLRPISRLNTGSTSPRSRSRGMTVGDGSRSQIAGSS